MIRGRERGAQGENGEHSVKNSTEKRRELTIESRGCRFTLSLVVFLFSTPFHHLAELKSTNGANHELLATKKLIPVITSLFLSN